MRAVLVEAPLWLVWRAAHGLELAWRALVGKVPTGRTARHRRPHGDEPAGDPGDPQEPGPAG
ncbi:hypothetical protein CF165_09165 [Amycolatopsis vastitatis]|uniref:Uncharacterized protein n=1 Tax=Amycolatopsis vastitatis TaxID=1905142 RepID=A0A229TES6_9PSEU|nr:hypothetical protein CF165_09165 [Amycolatopsis vastitatis]